MSASRSSLTARLKKLEAAQARADAMPSKTRLDARPMAELLGTTWVSVRDWCDEIPKLESSGAVVRGGNGIKWQFEPKRTIRILIAHFKGVHTRQAAKSREVAASVGVTLPEGEAPSMAETKDLVNLTLSVVAAAERERRFVEAEESRVFWSGWAQRVVDSILGVGTQVDPNGQMPPNIRALNDKYLRQVASAVYAEAERYIEENYIGELSEGLQQGRTS